MSLRFRQRGLLRERWDPLRDLGFGIAFLGVQILGTPKIRFQSLRALP